MVDNKTLPPSYTWQMTPAERLKRLYDLLAQQQAEYQAQQQLQQQGGVLNDAASLGGEALGAYEGGGSLLGSSAATAAPAMSSAIGGGGAAASSSAMGLGEMEALAAGGNGFSTPLAGSQMMTPAASGSSSMAAYAGPVALAALIAMNSKKSWDAQKKKGALTDKEINKIWDPVGTKVYDKVPFLKKIDLGYKIQSKLWGDNKYRREYRKAQALRDKGIDWGWNATQPKKGRSIDELIANAKASGGNVKFAASRNEADLTPVDTVGYSMWGEKYGNDYAKASLDKQLEANRLAQQAGALSEKKGTIEANKNFTSELDKLIRDALSKPAEAKKK